MGSVSARGLEVRKLDILGCKSGNFYFEYPKLTSSGSTLIVEGENSDRCLEKIEACVGVGIYSIKLGFSDGTSSPLIGGRDPTATISLGAQAVKTINVRAWNDNYIQALKFEGTDGAIIDRIESQN